MTAAGRIWPVPPEVRTLRSGDRMDAATFHRIYEEMPEAFRAELIGGVVYVASPLALDHGTNHVSLATLLGLYANLTTGLQCADNATVLLGVDGEPQPDVFVRILPEYGGQSTTTAENYVGGPPELIVEVSHSSWAIDLGGKYDDYRRYGVREYLVHDLHHKVLRWFDLTTDTELFADVDGVIRVRQFPGLWLHAAAIVSGDFRRAYATLQAGMATPEYAAFGERLVRR